jgi:hypothetical protein
MDHQRQGKEGVGGGGGRIVIASGDGDTRLPVP